MTRDEAFDAWMHLVVYDLDHGVVLCSLVFDMEETIPSPILKDIAVRRLASSSDHMREGLPSLDDDSAHLPATGPDLKAYLDDKIRSCVAKVLQLAADEIDSKAALSDLGVDSVMTVTLRRQL